jgi:hypothetical protein
MSLSQVLAALRQLRTDIERYELLRKLQQDNAGLFFQLLFQHTEELLPYVYAPTVGQACQEYCQRGFSTRELYLSAADKGRWVQLAMEHSMCLADMHLLLLLLLLLWCCQAGFCLAAGSCFR